jgi:hypothetical protein
MILLSHGPNHTQMLVFTALAVTLTQLSFDSAVSRTLLSHELSMFFGYLKDKYLSQFGTICENNLGCESVA